ncbi:hypothetical protein HRbin34_00299 [bacterium HR34]|nr:hypothetical protein HRbin34_00299 [bacterium HR34]
MEFFERFFPNNKKQEYKILNILNLYTEKEKSGLRNKTENIIREIFPGDEGSQVAALNIIDLIFKNNGGISETDIENYNKEIVDKLIKNFIIFEGLGENGRKQYFLDIDNIQKYKLENEQDEQRNRE